MRNWRHPFLIITAFLALFASALPSQNWFCPMTGRVGTAAFVCADMMPQCAEMGTKCCRPVTLALNGLTSETFSNRTSQTSQFAPDFEAEDAPTIAKSGARFELSPANASVLEHPFDFHFSSRHGPPLFSGRAPPLV